MATRSERRAPPRCAAPCASRRKPGMSVENLPHSRGPCGMLAGAPSAATGRSGHTMISRRAKIVCTIGPAVETKEGIRGLIEAGMDVARLNFSHGTHEEHGARIEMIRQESAALGKQVALLQDLCGPKIRTAKIGPAVLNN